MVLIADGVRACSSVEKLIETEVTEFVEGEQCALADLDRIKERIFGKIYEKTHNLKLSKDDLNYALMHCELSTLADEVLTRAEFCKRVIEYPLEDEVTLNDIWKHNVNCEFFFMKRCNRLISTINEYLDQRNHGKSQSFFVDYFDYEIIAFQEVRRYFPYCTDCFFQTELECLLWESVRAQVLLSTTLSRRARPCEIRDDLRELENHCKCVSEIKTVKELKVTDPL